MDKIGILGGSFDPFHNGHLSIATAAMKNLSLKKVYLMPTNVQPFKIGRKAASKKHRLNMAYEVTKEFNFMSVCELEIKSDKISYTYDTIVEFKKIHDEDIIFIMGTDSLMSIENWHKGVELLRACSFAVGARPGHDREKLKSRISYLKGKYGSELYLLDNEEFTISSTEIKKMVKNGEDISSYVPGSIERYIYEHKLYI